MIGAVRSCRPKWRSRGRSEPLSGELLQDIKVHVVSRNASKTERAKLLVFFVEERRRTPRRYARGFRAGLEF